MKREIKFRMWDDDEKRMVDDNELAEDFGFCIFSKTDGGHGMFGEVMQFTGLKDRLGKEIFEGDILKVYDWGVKTRDKVLTI